MHNNRETGIIPPDYNRTNNIYNIASLIVFMILCFLFIYFCYSVNRCLNIENKYPPLYLWKGKRIVMALKCFNSRWF